MTKFHTKYFAHELTRAGGTGVDRLGRALFDAQVDLNPHQIEAALFALRSPLSKGVLLADEVGLGKTIEAGLILCQKWAENQRKLLILVPASLRKQWAIELEEKFNLPTQILDSKTYNDAIKAGNPSPFIGKKIIICSLHFAASKELDISSIAWHLVVIDEAHKLRNAYKDNNRIGQSIKQATADCKKILLTATPLQNSLVELYGLSTLIDDNIFGDVTAFREQYMRKHADTNELRRRLQNFCHRTLRKQVTEYVSYTKRKLITIPFEPTSQELNLYNDVSNYILRKDAYAFPEAQRHLITTVVRKVLSSSPVALAATLTKIKTRLQQLLEQQQQKMHTTDISIEQYNFDEDLLAETIEDEEDAVEDSATALDAAKTTAKIDVKLLQDEINEIDTYIQAANNISVDTKTKSLLEALKTGFTELNKMGASPKAVVFTESRKTQQWLVDYLSKNGYQDQLVTFNGTNKDDFTGNIYQNWLDANTNTGRITNSRQVDMRAAILDHFKNNANILIATEAGAEGINMQFCSLVINFDLPWNPQRIEQRIGRCHRYGQKFDVVVINFLNQKNYADTRVYELLTDKFHLFDGVFGASDDVLGAIEADINFEKRIAKIYQECRSETEIKREFKNLQQELDVAIKEKKQQTEKHLIEHFDEDVHDRLKTNLANSNLKVDKFSKLFWLVTKYILADYAIFDEDNLSFQLHKRFNSNSNLGKYHLLAKNKAVQNSNFIYRLNHPLGEQVIITGKELNCDCSKLVFDISNNPTRILAIEQLKGNTGWLTLVKLTITTAETQEYLLFSAIDAKGNNLNQETCEKLFNCSGFEQQAINLPAAIQSRLTADSNQHIKATINTNAEETSNYINEACAKIERWAEDQERAAEQAIAKTKAQINHIRRQVLAATTIEEQQQLQQQIQKLETQKRKQRRDLDQTEDEIAEKRDAKLEEIQQHMQQQTSSVTLFTICWEVS